MEVGMVMHTVALEGRDPDRPHITPEEAREMAVKGFRFAEFDEAAECFKLSIPYKTAQNLERETLTFMQE
jgi:hypothetical protein